MPVLKVTRKFSIYTIALVRSKFDFVRATKRDWLMGPSTSDQEEVRAGAGGAKTRRKRMGPKCEKLMVALTRLKKVFCCFLRLFLEVTQELYYYRINTVIPRQTTNTIKTLQGTPQR